MRSKQFLTYCYSQPVSHASSFRFSLFSIHCIATAGGFIDGSQVTIRVFWIEDIKKMINLFFGWEHSITVGVRSQEDFDSFKNQRKKQVQEIQAVRNIELHIHSTSIHVSEECPLLHQMVCLEESPKKNGTEINNAPKLALGSSCAKFPVLHHLRD